MQESNASSNRQIVNDLESIQVLMNEQEVRLLSPFFAKEITISEAAARLNQPIYFLYRKVQRWLKLNLLKEVRQVSRRGRPIRYFTTSSKTFFVPANLIPVERSAIRDERLRQAIWLENLILFGFQISLKKDLGWKVTIDLKTGELVSSAALFDTSWTLLNDDAPVYFDAFESINLTFKDAKDFQQELAKLLQHYKHKHSLGGEKYLLRLGILKASES
jgi:hypothetical protein